MSALGNAIHREDWPWVAGWIAATHEVEVDPVIIASRCRAFISRRTEKEWSRFGRGFTWWGDGTWDMWLRNRLSDVWPKAGCQLHEDYHVTAIMHVFFWAIEETPEMLRNLGNEHQKEEAREARSKVFRTHLKPKPIDLTALLVATPPED